MSALCRGTRRVLFSERRTYATATHILRPPPPPTEEPHTVTFSGPSKPKLYYTRPARRDDLPQIKVFLIQFSLSDEKTKVQPLQKRWPFILAFAALGVSGWAAFLLVAMNQERLSSSVVRQILQTAREDKALQVALGDAIRFEPTWYLNGDPWISGSVCVSFVVYFIVVSILIWRVSQINLPQGNVDVSFRLKGHRG